MPMEIYGDVVTPEIKTFYSPVIEMVCAIHILTDPAHHQFEIKWAEDLLSKLNEEERHSLDIIKKFPAGGIELLNFVLDSGELESIDSFIEYIKGTDLLDFYFYILNEQIEKAKIQRAFNDSKERYKIQEKIKWIIEDESLMVFFDDPEDIKNNTVKIFQAIQEKGFIEKLCAVKEKMQEGIKYVNLFLGKDNIEVILEKISGRQKKSFLGYKEYNIIPSYFVSPRFIRVYSGDKLFVVFDCRVTRDKKEALLDELSNILKVIDDKSRMEILRILVNNKSYGKALSDIVGISTPTVSHHLEILKQAGFVKEEKIRNIKYFTADKERLKKVIEDINKYFFSAE